MTSIYYAFVGRSELEDAASVAGAWDALCARVAAMGFQSILVPDLSRLGADALDQGLAGMAATCQRYQLFFMMDLAPDHFAARAGQIAEGGERLLAWSNAGVAGFRCLAPAALAPEDWRVLVAAVHAQQPECCFMAWTPGMGIEQVSRLAEAGFEAAFLSLPWWDYRSSWLAEEHNRLHTDMAVVAPVEDPGNGPADRALQDPRHAMRALWTATFVGGGMLIPMGFEDLVGEQAVAQANRRVAQRRGQDQGLQQLSGPWADVTALFRSGGSATLLLVNPDSREPATLDWPALRSRLPHSYTVSDDGTNGLPEVLPACGWHVATVSPARTVKQSGNLKGKQLKTVTAALQAARIMIEHITPNVEQGRYPVKRTLGEPVQVQADIFMDGHDRIAASLLWRAMDEVKWRELAMEPLGNDRWQAQFVPDRLGRYMYGVRAWLDTWGTYCDALRKKFMAGQEVSLEIEEGRQLIRAALERARDNMPFTANVLVSTQEALGRPLTSEESRAAQIDLLLSEALADAMYAADHRPFEINSNVVYPLAVERREARFAAWYELFPRSQSPTPGVHGTLQDVVARLPAIRDMGFDVVYFPPIHPIGLRNRKGKNNATEAAAGDPGSPYAIGSQDGGHEEIHPELGTLDDFRELVHAAREQGLEIAMDFAIQCAPDHPWLTQRPEWFDWRVDGSLRYAENPPKRYEDIVNPDFYSPHASAAQRAALWRALRDVVLFWANQGVQTFRVDNPHTKPLPFWEWLIAEVQGVHPQTIFLSEAFTRPKLMYRLAQLGFSQSYTYFTWRNGKQELIDYLTELSTPPVADFFRPNFFVNTPDINPYFLQNSGRPGFLIRAVLAATTSGLWGVYNGFELCEARAIPGKEEYLDSEKYELRSWDWNRPGNIVAEITRLNQIRRGNPALQSHLGIRFHLVDNDQILFFSRTTPERDNVVLVAISLDPHGSQGGTLELPLWQWNMPDTATVQVQDLFDDHRFSLSGKYQRITLTPERPFAVWSLLPPV